MPPRRMLHIITRLDKGGSTIGTLWTVALLDRDRYDVVLVSGKTYDPDGESGRFLQEHAIKHYFINELQRELSLVNDVHAFIKLYQFIRREKFDLVHTHCSKAGILGRWAAWMAGVKHIVHTPHGHVFYGYFGKLKTLFFIWIERFTALITHKIIVLTDLGVEEHLHFGIAPREKFVTIPSGIDMGHFRPAGNPDSLKKQLQIPANLKIIGCVARLDPIKGVSFLVEAMPDVFKAFPQAVLLLVGDGSEREMLKARASQLGITDKIIFLGFRPDVVELLSVMDILVLPSLNEGMGRVVLEAMACQKSIVATSVGGVPELISSGLNGLLVPPQNPSALAAAILELLHDPLKAQKLAQEARQTAGDKYSLQTMLRLTDELYQGIT